LEDPPGSYLSLALASGVVDHAVDDREELLGGGEAEGLLPQPGPLVADQEEVEVVSPPDGYWPSFSGPVDVGLEPVRKFRTRRA
jgi:hypothetical protein